MGTLPFAVQSALYHLKQLVVNLSQPNIPLRRLKIEKADSDPPHQSSVN
ncbi:MAG: hypothetical protein H0W34_00420 [Pyrinomonadaceae bacterium]|nr:hypothetical protein [Pyrinomonadaceae bacterium]MDQ3172993.1 hypothetical protein [Acidobacteriota bacterium]